MSKLTRIQVNVPVNVKDVFEKTAAEYGMDLSNAIRFMMIQFNSKNIKPTIALREDVLSKKASVKYSNMIEESLEGVNVSGEFRDVDDIVESLEK